jgi:cytohesin
MTYHSFFDYRCPSCGLAYAPFRRGVKCPKCGSEPQLVYDMVSEALTAWFYHVVLYGRGTPPAYAILSLGDHYIHLSCIFLDLYVRELVEGEADAERFIRGFLARIDFKGHEYLVDHYREYFSDLLKRFDAAVKGDEQAAELLRRVESLWFFNALKEGELVKVKKCLERGISVEVRDEDGNTPLHVAASRGHLHIAKLLVESGADVNARNSEGMTPLHLAALHGHAEVAGLLIESGADVNAKDEHGKTPLHLAASHVDVARILVERGAEVNAGDESGYTPLHAAAASGSAEVARLLLERGADVSAKDGRGFTPLHWASVLCNVRVARLLLERGADPNARDERGETPLHWAAVKGHVDAVELLVKHGADVNARNGDGDTPLHLAAGKGCNISLLGERPTPSDLRRMRSGLRRRRQVVAGKQR